MNSWRPNSPLLDIRGLCVSFVTDAGELPVVNDVALAIPRGRVVALVGESGCGKSVTALSILRLAPRPGEIVGGKVLWHERGDSATDPPESPLGKGGGRPVAYASGSVRPVACAPGSDDPLPDGRGSDPVDLLTLDERAMRRIRGNRVAMIFQEPMTALHPVYSIGEQIVEAIELHQPLRGKRAWAEAVELLRKVGIAAAGKRVHDYPHQLSGGMRQRAMIAMALACRPALLIADEPTTALDVTIQAQILDLLRSLQAETGMSVLLITHDLGVVAETADYVYVMYAGRIVEHAPTAELLSDPLHPYTQGLLRCTPRIGNRAERLAVIPGAVPDPSQFPSGCRFHPRCALSVERASDTSRHSRCVGDAPYSAGSVANQHVLQRCVEEFEAEASGVPALREARSGHFVACWETM